MDITKKAHPRLMERFETHASPTKIVAHKNKRLISDGYEGLLIREKG